MLAEVESACYGLEANAGCTGCGQVHEEGSSCASCMQATIQQHNSEAPAHQDSATGLQADAWHLPSMRGAGLQMLEGFSKSSSQPTCP